MKNTYWGDSLMAEPTGCPVGRGYADWEEKPENKKQKKIKGKKMKKWLGGLLMAPLILFTVYYSGFGMMYLFEHEASKGFIILLVLCGFCAGFALLFGREKVKGNLNNEYLQMWKGMKKKHYGAIEKD